MLNLKYVSQTDNTLSRIPKQAKKQKQQLLEEVEQCEKERPNN